MPLMTVYDFFIKRAHDQYTEFDNASSTSDTTQSTTQYAIGIETVLNNMVFDVAWLFGTDSGSGGTTLASRQTIDLDRLVISATFGW